MSEVTSAVPTFSSQAAATTSAGYLKMCSASHASSMAVVSGAKRPYQCSRAKNHSTPARVRPRISITPTTISRGRRTSRAEGGSTPLKPSGMSRTKPAPGASGPAV